MPDAAPDPNALVMKYNPSDTRIAEVRAKYETIISSLPVLIAAEDAEPITSALKEIVPLRTELEKTRVQLKADSLAFGRRVDAEAQRLRSLILAFETPLQDAKAEIVAKEKARAEEKVKAEEAAAAEAKRIIDEAEAKVKKEQDEARTAAQKKLDDERAAFEKEQREAKERAETEQKERDRQKAELEAQAAKVKADLDKLEREKREAAEKVEREAREAEIRKQAEIDAKAKAEREAAEKEAKRIADEAEAARQKKILAEKEAAEAKAAEDAKPDIDKIHAFGDGLEKLTASLWPKVTAGCRAATFLADKRLELDHIAQEFKNFKFPKRGSK